MVQKENIPVRHMLYSPRPLFILGTQVILEPECKERYDKDILIARENSHETIRDKPPH